MYLSVMRDKLLISTESIIILPLLSSQRRNNDANRELFPAPVRPTTPIFSAGRVSNDTNFKLGGV